MCQKIVVVLVLSVIFAINAVADLTVQFVDLLLYERVPEEIEFDLSNQLAYKESFEKAYQAYLDERYLDSLDTLSGVYFEYPDMLLDHNFRLLEAELYFLLGADNPELQFQIAKPIYKWLFYASPNEKHEALVSFRLATILKRQGMHPEAEGMYRIIFERYSESKFAHDSRLGLAYSLFGQGKNGEALGWIAQLRSDSEMEPHTPFIYAMEAEINFREKRTKKAIELFLKANQLGLSTRDLSSEGQFYFAEALFENGKIEEAYKLHKDLIQAGPKSEFVAGALLRIADYEIGNGEREEALKHYQQLLDDYKESDPGYLGMIRVGDLRAQEHPNDLDEQVVRTYSEVADSLAPSSIANIAKRRLASYYFKGGKWQKAMNIASDLLRSKPTEYQTSDGKKIIKSAFNNYLIAKTNDLKFAEICNTFTAYRKEILHSRPDKSMINSVFEAHKERLLFDTILTIANEKIIKTKFLSLARFYGGISLMYQGKNREGINSIIWVANSGKEPEKSMALMKIAQVQQNNGDVNGTFSTLTRIVDNQGIPPEIFSEACILLGRRYVDIAEFQKGEKWFKKAVELIDPQKGNGTVSQLSDSIFGLADVSYRTDKKKQAKKLYEAAVGGFPQDVRSPMARLRLAELVNENDLKNITESDFDDAYWKWLVEKLSAYAQWKKERLSTKG